MDVPSALAVFYSDLSKPSLPSVAVAAGSYIFIYRNLRPYYRFTLPTVEIEEAEQAVWAGLRAGKLDASAAVAQLTEFRDAGGQLCHRSMNLLACTSQSDQERLIEQEKNQPLTQMVYTHWHLTHRLSVDVLVHSDLP